MLGQIKESLEADTQAHHIVLQVRVGRTRRFNIVGDILYIVGNKVYTPKWKELRRELLQECHDSAWARHPGQHRTLALLECGLF